MRLVLAFLILKVIYAYITPNPELSIAASTLALLTSFIILTICLMQDILDIFKAFDKLGDEE